MAMQALRDSNRAAAAQRFRYLVGRSASAMLDRILLSRLLPFSGRFPAGVHFEHDLRRFLGGAPETIVDAGANVGQTALRLNRFFPDATIHSFEPVRDTFDELARRCARIGNIKCVHAALGDVTGAVQMALNANSELNSLLGRAAGNQCEASATEAVSVMRLDEYAPQCGIGRVDLLKTDTEGYELHVLRGAARLLAGGVIRAVYAECGFVPGDDRKVNFSELDRHLSSHGFLFSGLYESYRWGSARQWVGFANGLWLHAGAGSAPAGTPGPA